MKVLIVGISTRPMCQSAAAAGYEVISLDFFGDRDQPWKARVLALGRDLQLPLTSAALASAASDLTGEVDAIMVESGLENDPAFFRLLSKGITWLSNPPDAVRLVRDPQFLNSISSGTAVRFPRTVLPGDQLPSSGNWIIKDQGHSGGAGVTHWDSQSQIPDGCLLQDYVEGQLCSLSFVSNGKEAVLLGLAQQYSGIDGLNAPPFAWCGNAVPLGNQGTESLLWPFVQALVEKSRLIGVNGVDFILSDGVPWVIEVNPRPGASLELYERLGGFNSFQMHVDAIFGHLPDQVIYQMNRAAAKGILYARQNLRILDHPDWLSGRFGDVPHVSEVIPGGYPVCSIFSQRESVESCWEEILNIGKCMQKERLFINGDD